MSAKHAQEPLLGRSRQLALRGAFESISLPWAQARTGRAAGQVEMSGRDAMPESRPRRLHIARRFVLHAIALGVLQGAWAQLGHAEAIHCAWQLRPRDTVWLVSSRGLGSCNLDENLARLKVWRFDRQRAWTPSQLVELTEGDDPQVMTVVFLHGNRISSCEAFTRGWRAYRRLVRCASERPIRFIVWSWPSARVRGPVEDARTKAARTDAHGYYVAGFLDQLDCDVPVSLWGFSYGARIATGALHLLGGGTLDGRRLEARVHAHRQPMRVALLAAALDDGWLLPGHRHGDARLQVRSMLLVNNGCDRVLARYHLLYGRRCCQEALGYVGLAVRRLPAEDAEKVRQMDACCDVGKRHGFDGYLASSRVMARVRGALLGEKPPTSEPPPQDVASIGVQLEPATP